MVAEGITRRRLPADNAVLCTLHHPDVPALAVRLGNTRSAAALELWRPHLAGAVVASGSPARVLTEALLREVFRIRAGVSPSPYHGRPHIHLMAG